MSGNGEEPTVLPSSDSDLQRLLHEVDGHLGLAVYRGEGGSDEWKEEARGLMVRVREAAKTPSGVLDADDLAVYGQAFVLASAVRRFLAWQRTREVIEMGWMLDADVVADLVEASEAMEVLRGQRIANARNAAEFGARS